VGGVSGGADSSCFGSSSFVVSTAPSSAPSQSPHPSSAPEFRTFRVSSETQLKAAIRNDTLVELDQDIFLTSTLALFNVHGLEIKGNGFAISGDGTVRCIQVTGASTSVSIAELIVTNGYSKVFDFRVTNYISPL
jgi:hypothetical protein